jgi:class III poly(R)-hydroxyalkanoic acid synthase PhaE subunit
MANETLFTDNWLKLQQQYWEGLTDMGRKAMGLEAPRQNPWEAAMDQWWKAVSPAASDPAKLFMDRLLEQGKAYFATVERFTRGLTDGGDGTAGWDTLNKTLEDMQRAFTSGLGAVGKGADVDQTWHKMLGFWEMPLDNWQRMMSSLSPMMPGDLLRNMPHDQVSAGMDRMLSAPGLGYTREEQAQYQDLIRRSLDYQRAMQEYMGFFGKLGMESVQRFKAFIQSRADAGEPVDSARGLYDNWVACCEAVYADEVSTPEYARIHGQLVNAQMALKKRMAVMVDESLGAMNMPTRSELRTLQDRMQETRRENKRLRREMDAIKRHLGVGPAASAADAPTAPKKKAVARKKTAVRQAPGAEG